MRKIKVNLQQSVYLDRESKVLQRFLKLINNKLCSFGLEDSSNISVYLDLSTAVPNKSTVLEIPLPIAVKNSIGLDSLGDALAFIFNDDYVLPVAEQVYVDSGSQKVVNVPIHVLLVRQGTVSKKPALLLWWDVKR